MYRHWEKHKHAIERAAGGCEVGDDQQTNGTNVHVELYSHQLLKKGDSGSWSKIRLNNRLRPESHRAFPETPVIAAIFRF